MGVLIQFPARPSSRPPTRPKRCELCINSISGTETYCLLFQEAILNERSAEDCGEFIDDESRS